jgi:hypothetical protein
MHGWIGIVNWVYPKGKTRADVKTDALGHAIINDSKVNPSQHEVLLLFTIQHLSLSLIYCLVSIGNIRWA